MVLNNFCKPTRIAAGSLSLKVAEKLVPDSPKKDRLDIWYDGSAICIIAVGARGDPLDLGEEHAEELLHKLKACIAQAKQGLV